MTYQLPKTQIIQHWQGWWALYDQNTDDIYGRPVFFSWDVEEVRAYRKKYYNE